MKKILLSSAVVAFMVTSAFAQTAVTSEYYVVRDATTKKCTIVDKKPTTTTTTVVDNGVFKTRTEAETGMKTMRFALTDLDQRRPRSPRWTTKIPRLRVYRLSASALPTFPSAGFFV